MVGGIASQWASASAAIGVTFFVGSIFFTSAAYLQYSEAVNVAALNHDLSTHQMNTRVWAPDAFGSTAFLLSSELAFAEVCHRWVCLRRRSLSWRIVALNLLGSVAFGVSAVASLVAPSTGEPLSARIANGGTSLGGICFLIAALLLLPEAAKQERAPRTPPRVSPSASPAG